MGGRDSLGACGASSALFCLFLYEVYDRTAILFFTIDSRLPERGNGDGQTLLEMKKPTSARPFNSRETGKSQGERRKKEKARKEDKSNGRKRKEKGKKKASLARQKLASLSFPVSTEFSVRVFIFTPSKSCRRASQSRASYEVWNQSSPWGAAKAGLATPNKGKKEKKESKYWQLPDRSHTSAALLPEPRAKGE